MAQRHVGRSCWCQRRVQARHRWNPACHRYGPAPRRWKLVKPTPCPSPTAVEPGTQPPWPSPTSVEAGCAIARSQPHAAAPKLAAATAQPRPSHVPATLPPPGRKRGAKMTLHPSVGRLFRNFVFERPRLLSELSFGTFDLKFLYLVFEILPLQSLSFEFEN